MMTLHMSCTEFESGYMPLHLHVGMQQGCVLHQMYDALHMDCSVHHGIATAEFQHIVLVQHSQTLATLACFPKLRWALPYTLGFITNTLRWCLL